jgi:hypothetical protein
MSSRPGVRAGRMVRTGETREQNLSKQGDGNTLVRPDKTRQTGNRQTENSAINTLGIMRKMGYNWRRVETSTKTGETDQGDTLA